MSALHRLQVALDGYDRASAELAVADPHVPGLVAKRRSERENGVRLLVLAVRGVLDADQAPDTQPVLPEDPS